MKIKEDTKEKAKGSIKYVFHGYAILILGSLSWFTFELMYNHVIRFLSVDFIEMIFKIPEEYQFVVWAVIGVQVLLACIQILKFTLDKMWDIIKIYVEKKTSLIK